MRDEVDRASTLNGELLLEIEEFVNGLPSKQRLALVLRKYQRLDYDEIAANLGIGEGTARSNVYQAYRKLRDQFTDQLTNE